MTQSSANIGRKMAKGAAWMVGMRFAMRGIGLVSTLILARLLVPADFGLVALATLLFGVLLIFGEFGFDNYLIKHQDADRSYYDTVWTLTIIRGLLLAITLAVGAPLAVDFFNEPRLQAILYCLAGIALLMSLNNVGVVDFRKEMTFGREFTYTIAPKIGSFLVTVVCAILWRDYWALVVGIAANHAFRLVISFTMHSYRPRLSLLRLREVIGFSVWLLLNNIFYYVNMRSGEFVIGRMLGAGSVGVFSVAFEVSNMPTSELVAPIRRAIFPGYARMAVRPESLRDGFIDVWSLILLVVAPMAFGIYLTADYLVALALGPKWLHAVPLIKILALYGFFSTLSSNAGPVFLALGRPSIITFIAGFHMVLKIPALVWAISVAGTTGAAWASTIVAALASILTMVSIIRVLNLSVRGMLAASWRTAVAAAVMAGVVVQIDYAMAGGPGTGEIALKLLTMAGVGAAVYVLVALGLWHFSGRPDHSAETSALKLTRPVIRRAFPASFFSAGSP